MRQPLVGVLALTLFVASGTVAASRCVLPVPDGGDITPSPASLIGKIVSVTPGQLLVRRKGAAKPLRIVVAPSTELFTVYGGDFDAQELRPGQHVLIWYKDCSVPMRRLPVAAVLQVCSLAPEPCPT